MIQSNPRSLLERARVYTLEGTLKCIRLLRKRLWFWLFIEIWARFWTVILRLTIRKEKCDRTLFDLEGYWINKLVNLPRAIGKLLIKTKLPDGIIVIEKDISSLLVDEIYTRALYEKHYKIRKGDIVIDVGAHVGVFTLKASRRANNGLIIAVEPNPQNYKLLLENIKRNELRNVIALNIALSNYDGVARLYTNDSMIQSSAEHSIVKQVSKKYLEVTVKKLDTILDELQLDKVNMIKIDAEGAELEILQGALNTLRRSNVHLAIATYHKPTETREVSEYLKSIEYNNCNI